MIFTLSCVYTLICFLIEKITKGKKPLYELLGPHICGWKDFLDQHWKCLQMRLLILMYFTCNIYIETSGSTLAKKCCLIRNLTYSLEWNAMKKVCKLYDLNTCKFPQQADKHQHQDLGVCVCVCVCVWEGGGSTLWFLWHECPLWPKNL